MAGTGTEPELHAGKMAKATPGAAPLGPAVFAVLQSRQEFLPSSLWLWVHNRTSDGIIKAGQDAVPALTQPCHGHTELCPQVPLACLG